MAKYHGRHMRVYVDGYDISGYTNNLSVNTGADVVDVSGFSDGKKNYVVGLFDSQVEHDGFFDDTATVGGHAVLNQRLGSAVHFMASVGVLPGAAAFMGSAELEQSYSITSAITDAVKHKSKMINFGTQGVDDGLLLATRGTISGGTTEAVAFPLNTLGGRAYLQNFGSFGLASGTGGALGTVWVIGAADAAFTSGTEIVAAFGSQGTAPSASGVAFSSTAKFMKLLQGGGTFMPQVAAAVSID